MLVKIGNVGFHSKEVKYHDGCKRRYLNDTRDELKKANAPPAEEKQVNYAAVKNIFMYIESSVIDNHRPEYLVSLHRHYCQYLEMVMLHPTQCEPLVKKLCNISVIE